MKRHLFAIAVGGLLVFVLVSLVMLYKFATQNLAQGAPQVQISSADQTNVEKNDTDSWIKSLASIPQRQYVLAANEIFIEFKNEIKTASKIVNQLIIDKNDIYSMFCLSQILDQIPVDFSVTKQNSQNLIYINTQDKNVLKRIADELKTYNIHSTFKEIKL